MGFHSALQSWIKCNQVASACSCSEADQAAEGSEKPPHRWPSVRMESIDLDLGVSLNSSPDTY